MAGWSISGEGVMNSLDQIVMGNITIPPNPYVSSGVNQQLSDSSLVKIAVVVAVVVAVVFALFKGKK